MSNYNPSNITDPLVSTSDDGNSIVSYGSTNVTANLTTADKVRPCRVAAGTKVHRVVVKNVDLDSGANLSVKIGFQAIDGSAQVSGDDTAISATATTWQAAATTTYEIFPPFLVTKDSYLECVPTVGGVGTGLVSAKVEGEGVGAA